MNPDGNEIKRPNIVTTGYLNDRLQKTSAAATSRANLLRVPTAPGRSQMSNNSPRQKVILKPGHSALDWESTKKKPNFRQNLPPFPLKVSKDELKKHNTLDDYWIAINRKVYDLTPYLDFHPGGIPILKACAGKDGTLLFNKYHPWINLDRILDLCFVGILV